MAAIPAIAAIARALSFLRISDLSMTKAIHHMTRVLQLQQLRQFRLELSQLRQLLHFSHIFPGNC